MPSNKEVMISLRDIAHILKRSRKTVIASTLGFAAFTALWTLTEPVKYMATASYKEKTATPAGMSAQFSAAMLGHFGKPDESEAATAFKSEMLIARVIKKLNLQASISDRSKYNHELVYLSRIGKNLKNAYYQWVHTFYPLFSDPEPEDVKLTSIHYAGEFPYQGISIVFEDDDTFVMRDGLDSIRGRIGDSIGTKDYRFKIERNNPTQLKGRTFDITILPMTFVVKAMVGQVTAKVSLEDKNLINLTFTDLNRKRSAEFLNAMMESYNDFLKDQQKTVANAQLAYLHERQGEMNQIVRDMMKDHATKISTDLLSLGFPNAQAAMDFLSNSQAQQQQRALMINLEKMMLTKAKDSGYSHYDNITPHGDPGTINAILKEIRELNKQRDNIELTLEQRGQNQDLTSFHVFIEELEALKRNSDSAKDLLAELDKGQLPSQNNILANNSKYLVSHWMDQLRQADDAAKHADNLGLQAKQQTRDTVKQQFSHYLNQMIRIFDMHSDILQQRMAQQQNPRMEYEGIELGAAREIYLSQSKQIQELEAQTLQHHFIIENIQRPDFEVGSLSGFLQDSVSQQMIQQVSQLSLQLNDYHNRSEKEKERLREEILVKKGFLVSHLKQSSQLLLLRQKLLKEKMRSLQETTVALIQQQISLLEKHLADYIDSRLIDLDNESEVIAQHQRDLNEKMATLPIKWSDEHMIRQQMDLNQSVAGEVSRLIETKNLVSNLELNRSSPMDTAFAPIKPISPRLPLFILIGLFMGTFLSVSFLMCKALFRGVPISKENLLLSGYHCSGILRRQNKNRLLDCDLETLRAITAFMPRSSQCHTLLIAENEAVQYSKVLISLLARQGLRVLYLDLTFTKANEKEGLLQYLEGTISTPKVITHHDHSEILSGGISRFGSEKIAHKRFQELLTHYKPHYDWIIASTMAPPLSAETNELRRQFDYTVLTIDGETQQDLPPADECSKVTFVMVEIL